MWYMWYSWFFEISCNKPACIQGIFTPGDQRILWRESRDPMLWAHNGVTWMFALQYEQCVHQTHVDLICHTKNDKYRNINYIGIESYSIVGHIMTFNEICNDYVLWVTIIHLLAQLALQSGACQYSWANGFFTYSLTSQIKCTNTTTNRYEKN